MVSFTSSWLSTFPERAMRSAISPMGRFSSAVSTGPRRVTRSSMVMIFTFGPRTFVERSTGTPHCSADDDRRRVRIRALPAQIMPSKSRTTRITRTKPSPPVGPYPQFRLCGQVGRAPINIRTSKTTKIVPNIIFLSKCEWVQPTRQQRLCTRLMALSTASSMEVVEVPVSSMSLQMWSFMFGSSGIRASIARNVRLLVTAGGAGFLDRLFDRFAGFARALLNPANKFFLLAFGILEIVIRELSPLLFQLPLGDVPVAFDFKFVHNTLLCFVFRFCSPPM